jgi:hypothetical protein
MLESVYWDLPDIYVIDRRLYADYFGRPHQASSALSITFFVGCASHMRQSAVSVLSAHREPINAVTVLPQGPRHTRVCLSE